MRLTTAVFVLVLFAGCPEDGPNGNGVVCTEIGCEDGFTIDVVGPGGSEVGEFLAQVTIGGSTVEADCAAETLSSFDGFRCGLGMILLDYTEEQVGLVVETADGELGWEGTIEPGYQEVYPNGPDCPPVCLQGGQTVELAELSRG